MRASQVSGVLIGLATAFVTVSCKSKEPIHEPIDSAVSHVELQKPKADADAPKAKPTPPTRGKLEPADSPEQTRALGLIEKVTGLKFKETFPVYVFSAEELAAEMAEWKEAGDTREPENILGFYKSSTKAMYLVPEAAGNRRAFGLRVHEATHALQDQHFGLAALHKSAGNDEDKQLAMLALIEGHAVQVMIDAIKDTNPHVARIADAPEPADPKAPGAMTAYAYAAGTRFVRWLLENGLDGETGYAAVHRAFRSPPVSPAEIRDPASYKLRVSRK